MSLRKAMWRGGLWGSQFYPNGNGPWRGGLWASQRQGGGGGSLTAKTLDELSYTGTSLSMSAANHGAVVTSPDGAHIFVFTGTSLLDYVMSTPWDLSTASLNQTFTPPNITYGGDFSGDGAVMILAEAGSANVRRYSLSTPWDIGTATEVSLDPLPSMGAIYHAKFSDDGMRLFAADYGLDDAIREYSLGLAYDTSSATHANELLHGSSSITAFDVYDDGTRLILGDADTAVVSEYVMSTPWDLSTASSSGLTLDVSTEETTPRGLCFGNEGQVMYLTGYDSEALHQYG